MFGVKNLNLNTCFKELMFLNKELFYLFTWKYWTSDNFRALRTESINRFEENLQYTEWVSLLSLIMTVGGSLTLIRETPSPKVKSRNFIISHFSSWKESSLQTSTRLSSLYIYLSFIYTRRWPVLVSF